MKLQYLKVENKNLKDTLTLIRNALQSEIRYQKEKDSDELTDICMQEVVRQIEMYQESILKLF